jgi:DNA-binding NarL/FixJ family response regulator
MLGLPRQLVKEGEPSMSPSLDKRTAILVDQHPLWMDTVEQVVRRAGVEVLAKVTSSTVAYERVGELQPDLLVAEIKMADGEPDGLALLRMARDRLPGLRTIVLSMYDDANHIDAAFAAGAEAYVLKTAHPDDLTSAVRQAFQHSIYLAGSRPAAAASAGRASEVDDALGLTRREREILQLVAEGHSNAQLARMLWVTEQTVKFHLSNIYRKLGVSNRTEASRWAQRQGLLDNPSTAQAAA